jgi:hypothetical protein
MSDLTSIDNASLPNGVKQPPRRLARWLLGMRSAELRVGAFGKLPFYKDFISYNPDKRNLHLFRQWLEEGFSTPWPLSGGERPQLRTPYRLLNHTPGAAEMTVAVIWNSSDGKRLFPFSLFAALPIKGFSMRRGLIPLYLKHLWEQLQDLHEVCSRATEINELYSILKEAVLKFDPTLDENVVFEEWKSFILNTPLKTFAAQLTHKIEEETWLTFLHNIRLYLAYFSGSRRAAGNMAFNLPLASALPYVEQAEFWLEVLSCLLPGSAVIPNLLLPFKSGRSDSCSFVFRKFVPQDALIMSKVVSEYEQIQDISTQPMHQEEKSEEGEPNTTTNSMNADVTMSSPPEQGVRTAHNASGEELVVDGEQLTDAVMPNSTAAEQEILKPSISLPEKLVPFEEASLLDFLVALLRRTPSR